jgi:two-component system sensor histidine kinase TctE
LKNQALKPAASIRRRLLFIFLAPLTLVIGIGVVVDYVTAVIPVTTAYDEALADAATAIALHLTTAADGSVAADLPPQAIAILRTDRFDAIYFRVAGPRDEIVAGDADLPVADAGIENPAYRNVQFRGQPVRVTTYRSSVSAGAVSVSVAETTRKREAATRAILTGTVLTDLLQLAATLLLGWFGVRYGLRPLMSLRDQITARSARDLAPLDEGSVPEEVRPVTHALNALFARVSESVLAQRQFLANAAHQLRTPLAGVRAHLELLTRSPNAEPVRHELETLSEGLERLGHTANQLLALARAERSAIAAEDFAPVDLQPLIESALEDHMDCALTQDLDLAGETLPVRVHGISWLLRELLMNLVDNAVAYTPRGGHVTARCGVDEGRAFLEVEDDGPGIPPDERTRVLQRFYRLHSATGSGCGLGLAIVDEIAQLHGAALTMSTGANGRGTRVRVAFPTVA